MMKRILIGSSVLVVGAYLASVAAVISFAVVENSFYGRDADV